MVSGPSRSGAIDCHPRPTLACPYPVPPQEELKGRGHRSRRPPPKPREVICSPAATADVGILEGGNKERTSEAMPGDASSAENGKGHTPGNVDDQAMSLEAGGTDLFSVTPRRHFKMGRSSRTWKIAAAREASAGPAGLGGKASGCGTSSTTSTPSSSRFASSRIKTPSSKAENGDGRVQVLPAGHGERHVSQSEGSALKLEPQNSSSVPLPPSPLWWPSPSSQPVSSHASLSHSITLTSNDSQRSSPSSQRKSTCQQNVGDSDTNSSGAAAAPLLQKLSSISIPPSPSSMVLPHTLASNSLAPINSEPQRPSSPLLAKHQDIDENTAASNTNSGCAAAAASADLESAAYRSVTDDDQIGTESIQLNSPVLPGRPPSTPVGSPVPTPSGLGHERSNLSPAASPSRPPLPLPPPATPSTPAPLVGTTGKAEMDSTNEGKEESQSTGKAEGNGGKRRGQPQRRPPKRMFDGGRDGAGSAISLKAGRSTSSPKAGRGRGGLNAQAGRGLGRAGGLDAVGGSGKAKGETEGQQSAADAGVHVSRRARQVPIPESVISKVRLLASAL